MKQKETFMPENISQLIMMTVVSLGSLMVVGMSTLACFGIWKKIRESDRNQERELRLKEMEHERQMKELELERLRLTSPSKQGE